MAVVFISPKQRQKVFFIGITAVVLLFVAIFAAVVFFAPIKSIAPELVFNKPKLDISMDTFNSEEFKNLKPFEEMQFQFSYKGFDKNNKAVEGFITAATRDEATKILQDMNYSISELKEIEAGRDNPFTPYYQIVETKPAPTKK